MEAVLSTLKKPKDSLCIWPGVSAGASSPFFFFNSVVSPLPLQLDS